MSTKIKLCGLKSLKDIEMVNRLMPDYVGFVLWEKSHRNVSEDTLRVLKSALDKRIRAVGVFVDETVEKVSHYANAGLIDVIQLHGDEDEAYIAQLRSALSDEHVIIKAFKVEGDNLEKAGKSTADMLLFDPGKGDGMTFSWEVLKNFDRPFFLAGGLNSENVADAIKMLNPYAVDVSSGIETDKVKDSVKAEAFVNAVLSCQNGEQND